MENRTALIVVAEDEALIRMGIVDALTDEGFEVLEARHAAEAIGHMDKHGADVSILFTDIHMPGDMDGVALAHRARNEWPLIGLIVTSGKAAPDPHELPEGSRFVSKPYEITKILDHIRELVAGGA